MNEITFDQSIQVYFTDGTLREFEHAATPIFHFMGQLVIIRVRTDNKEERHTVILPLRGVLGVEIIGPGGSEILTDPVFDTPPDAAGSLN